MIYLLIALAGALAWLVSTIAAGAVCGVVIGRRQLLRLSEQRFRVYMLSLMLVAGVLMLYRGLRHGFASM